jgi:hypothetical protein
MTPEINSKAEARAQGLKRYFTGRPCRRSHLAERYLDGHCVECERERYRAGAKADNLARRRATALRRCICTERLNVQTGPKWRRLEVGEDPTCRCPGCLHFLAAASGTGVRRGLKPPIALRTHSRRVTGHSDIHTRRHMSRIRTDRPRPAPLPAEPQRRHMSAPTKTEVVTDAA